MLLALIALRCFVSVSKKQFLQMSDALMEDASPRLCFYLIKGNENQLYNMKNAV